jgi:hypothetical protein
MCVYAKMEVAMLIGLAALGYSLSTQPAQAEAEEKQHKKDPIETFVNPEPTLPETERVSIVQSSEGHNNMVPFFGARQTQSLYSGATDGLLDLYTGKGKHTFFHKEEAPYFFEPEAGNGLPWGKQVETDFEQSRMVTSMAMKNVFPVERVNVGPGVNDGYTNLPSGGYQQDAMREYALPKTTDELRVANKAKLTYEGEVVPGAHFITEMGIQPPVKKNKPDRFQILQKDDGSLPYVNTTLGQQVASAIYPENLMKLQNRESTSAEFKGGAQAAAGGYLSYIRAFTEPFQEFMKLTTVGRPTPAGPVGGAAIQGGPQSVNVAVHKDESIFNNIRGFEAPLYNIGGQVPSGAQQGSTRYVVPLQQDIYVERNGPEILDAFKSNPYTKSLQSVA